MKVKWSGLLAKLMIFALLTGLLTGFAPAAEKTEIKVGVLCPLTGPISAYGQDQKNAVEMALDEINTAGGILGKKLVMQVEDDEKKPELAASMTQKLINDGVDVIIGGMSSSETMAGGPIATSKKALMISPWSTNPKATDGQWVFRACFSDAFQGKIQANYMAMPAATSAVTSTTATTETVASGLGCKKPAQLLDVGDDGSKGQGEVVEATLKAAGIPLVAKESYSTGDKDFKAQLTKIKALGPDCLDTPNYYQEVALIRIQMKELGMDIPHIGGDGVDSEDFFKIAGPAATGMMITTHYSPEDPRPIVQNFRAKFKAKYGMDPASTAALSYDAVQLYKMAVEKAGSLDKQAIRDALAGLKDVTNLVTAPTFTMDNTGTGVKSLAVVQAGDDGKWHFKAVVNP
jgi:branched-chain amino acid transport system substrate-binding protein